MLQLSYDRRRLYVTNSLYSTWDNQFYPELRSWLLRVNCDPDGGMEVDRDFFVDFSDHLDGHARAHEVRSKTATARRRSSNERAHHVDPHRGDRPSALASWRGDPIITAIAIAGRTRVRRPRRPLCHRSARGDQ
jgi:56kDa selenium binding protein (SBP56)